MNKHTQDNNWHTLEQIKAMGNRVLSRAGEILITERGEMVTIWTGPDEDHKYSPVNARTVYYL